jgi:hypothetical protein
MVLQLAMRQDEVVQDVVEVASVEAGRAQGVNLVRTMPMVLREVMAEAALGKMAIRRERMVKERLQKGAVDHVSLTVVVAAVVATMMWRLVMSLVVPLAGPMSATVAQGGDMQ